MIRAVVKYCNHLQNGIQLKCISTIHCKYAIHLYMYMYIILNILKEYVIYLVRNGASEQQVIFTAG